MTRRLLQSLLVLAVVLALNFILFRIMPGDPVASIVDPRFSPEAKAALRAQYGLDRPMPEQFLLYLEQMTTFRFGVSFLTGRPVIEELASRLPNTVALLATSLALSAVLGIWLGIRAAARRGSWVEKFVLLSGAVTFSFPSFFVQLVLLMVFSVFWPIFPLRGTVSIPPMQGIAGILDYARHLALPVISLVILGFGGWALYVRNLMVKTLSEDFILLARARGLTSRRILWGHAFRTVLPPILTVLLLSLPGIVSGAVITETVFSLHGVGRFLLDSVTGHDYPAAGAAFYILALLTVGCNILADVLYRVVDPRVRAVGRS